MYTCRGCMLTMSNALETDDRTSLIIVGTRELEITHNKKITKEIRKEKAIEYANRGLRRWECTDFNYWVLGYF